MEAQLTELAAQLWNNSSEERISYVQILSDLETTENWRSGERPIQASTNEVDRIWEVGYFRLFVSHSSKNKEFAEDLKETLKLAGIDAFIAHRDIEPDQEWQREIKLGLSSCHALLFISTEASNRSCWCQQEVGWAQGRGIFVTSYILEAPPNGFAGALQGWKVPCHELPNIRKRLVETFAKDDRTERAMREPLVKLVESCRTARKMKHMLEYIAILKSLNQEQLGRLDQVRSRGFMSVELERQILETLRGFGFTPPAPVSECVSFDEYDPFADQ